MMICPSCNQEQESGKFCGSCGSTMVVTSSEKEVGATSETVHSTSTANITSNENLTKAKNLSQMYGKHALGLLKRPSLAFELNENHFVNGLITIVLYALTFALSLYFLANKLYKTMMSGFGFESFLGESGAASSLPFFDITFKLLLTGLVFVAIGMITASLTTKLMGTGITFKAFLSQYSGVLVPFAGLNVVATLLGLMGSIWGTLILLGVSLQFVILLMPGFFVYEYSKSSKPNVDRLYWGFGSILASMLLTYMVSELFVGEFLTSLSLFEFFDL